MTQEEYIKKWIEGTLSGRDREIFEGSDDFKTIQKISTSTLRFKAPDFDIEAELARLDLAGRKEGKVVQMPVLKPWMRAAAVLFIIFSTITYFYTNRYSETVTAPGQMAEIYLPDSSKVLINTKSTIRYKPFGWTSHREIVLDGEAYFEVAKGSTFQVLTSLGTTRVLGTKFNVKQRDDYFEVQCFEGRVGVSSMDNAVKLDAGSGFRLLNNIATTQHMIEGIVPSWIEGQSDFTSVPLIQVIREFERQYHKTISAEGVDVDQLYTGSFEHNNEVLALQAITIPMNLTWKTDGEHTIILTAQGE